MKSFLTATILMALVTPLFSQPVNWKKIEQQQPDKILLNPAQPPAKALLLGTFHFGYPNLDAHKTDSSQMMDILSAQRQKEIRQLIDVLATYKPTRIYVEGTRQSRMDSLYNAYVKGTYTLKRDEIDQIAFRLAKELALPKLYAVDASNFLGENEKKYTWIDSMWDSQKEVDTLRDKENNRRYNKLYKAGDSTEIVNTILETFLVMAEQTTLNRMNGHYLSAYFNTSDNSGPDRLAMWWYDRNLRIFNNILKTRPISEDRILVLFGNGHMPILKHCFASSPEFEVVELKSLVKKMEKAGKLKQRATY